MRLRGLVLVAFLTLLPLASAQTSEPIALEGEQDWNLQTLPRDAPGAFDYFVGFRLDVEREAYIKALPTPWNAAYANGTVDGEGWWTEFAFLADAQAIEKGATNGTDVVELGTLEANVTHRLRVRVHAPAEALEEEATYRLSYALAVRPPGAGSGSGGNLDPSISVLPELEVYRGAPGDASVETGKGPAPLFWGMVVGGVLVIVALATFVLWRRARRGKAQGASL